MNIGEAAQATGVTAKMIRHYESIGLLPQCQRSAAGYRIYSDTDLGDLRFIRRARRLGFSLEQVGELLSLWHDGNRASAEVKAIASSHLDELEVRIRELSEMRDILARLVGQCAGDLQPDCQILGELGKSDI